MNIATLNLAHPSRRPHHVPLDLLDALLALDADLWFLTELVQTDAYLAALRVRWPHVLTTAQLHYGPSRSATRSSPVSAPPTAAPTGPTSPPTSTATS